MGILEALGTLDGRSGLGRLANRDVNYKLDLSQKLPATGLSISLRTSFNLGEIRVREQMRNGCLLLAVATILNALACIAHADLILDINFGNPETILIDDEATDGLGNPIDGISLNRSLGFAGEFFGQSVTSVDVSSNGNLNFSGDTDFIPEGGATPVARISPLWEDLYLYPTSGARVKEHKVANTVYAVTWENAPLYLEPTTQVKFQVAWFNQSMQIGNFQFQPQDIAFSYDFDPNSISILYAVIGLNNGTGDFQAFHGDLPNPGTPLNNKPGFLNADEARLVLPVGVGDFFLFRPDGNNGYLSTRENLFSSQSAIPEPSSWALLAISSSGFFLYRRLRKSKPKPSDSSTSL